MSNTVTDEQLVRYLTGEADEALRNAVTQWLQASEANSRYYASFVWAAAQTQLQADTSHIDTEAEWQAFTSRLQQNAPPAPARLRMLSRWQRIAAVLLLVAGVFIVYLIAGRHNTAGMLTSGSRVMTGTLPDGTVITLNKKSAVHYGRAYNKQNREVQLEGEAFFAVAPDRQRPFIVRLQDAEVEVLGTSFNIRSADDKTEIVVETGEVMVKRNNVLVHVHAKEKAILYKNNPAPLKQPAADSLYRYYRTRQFVCNGTPLAELVNALNTAYDQQIVLADKKLAQLPITATFTGKSLNNILDIVCRTLQLDTVQHGNTIVIKQQNTR
jgi:ferric-dicitrate binding protein FerR (iron transport regulator)